MAQPYNLLQVWQLALERDPVYASAQASRNGEPLGEPMEIVVRRPMEYADSEILGKGEEEAMIWQDMRRDAAQQIVRRLGFLKAQ